VICSSCGAENRPGRKFCVRCATPLAAACPSCGAPYDPSDAFALLVGSQDPSALAAAEEARAIFERVGARPYIERLEAVPSRPEAVGRATGSGGVAERSVSRG
jgi:hypothetical protein